jgi:hypothetical protein
VREREKMTLCGWVHTDYKASSESVCARVLVCFCVCIYVYVCVGLRAFICQNLHTHTVDILRLLKNVIEHKHATTGLRIQVVKVLIQMLGTVHSVCVCVCMCVCV